MIPGKDGGGVPTPGGLGGDPGSVRVAAQAACPSPMLR